MTTTVSLILGSVSIASYAVVPATVFQPKVGAMAITGYSPHATNDAADYTAPSIPVLSLVTNNDSLIHISWPHSTDDDTGIYRYFVYLNDVSLDELISVVTEYTFTGLNAQTEYRLQVKSMDVVGNESSLSDYLVVTTDFSEIPSIPLISATAVSSKQVNIRWVPDEDANFPTYRLYRNDVAIEATTKWVYADVRLASNTQYKYQVEAVADDGTTTGKSKSFYITTDPRGFPSKWENL